MGTEKVKSWSYLSQQPKKKKSNCDLIMKYINDWVNSPFSFLLINSPFSNDNKIVYYII